MLLDDLDRTGDPQAVAGSLIASGLLPADAAGLSPPAPLSPVSAPPPADQQPKLAEVSPEAAVDASQQAAPGAPAPAAVAPEPSLLGLGLVRRLLGGWGSSSSSASASSARGQHQRRESLPAELPEDLPLAEPLQQQQPAQQQHQKNTPSSASDDFILEAPPPRTQAVGDMMRGVAHRITDRLRQLPVPAQISEMRIYDQLRSSYDSTLQYINDKVKEKVEARLETLLENQVRPWLTKTCLNPNMPRPVYEAGERALDSIWPDIKEEIWALYEQNILGTSVPMQAEAPAVDLAERSLGERARAFLLYHVYPYDKSFWAQIRDPWWWVFKVPALCPLYNISSLWFAMLLALLDRTDFFQMFNFILQFKGTQFFSLGLFELLHGWLRYWYCVNLSLTAFPDPGGDPDAAGFGHSCDLHGAGVAKTFYSNAFGFGLRLALVWLAFHLLGAARKRRSHVLSWTHGQRGGDGQSTRMTPYRRHLLEKARRRRAHRLRKQQQDKREERRRRSGGGKSGKKAAAAEHSDSEPQQGLRPKQLDWSEFAAVGSPQQPQRPGGSRRSSTGSSAADAEERKQQPPPPPQDKQLPEERPKRRSRFFWGRFSQDQDLDQAPPAGPIPASSAAADGVADAAAAEEQPRPAGLRTPPPPLTPARRPRRSFDSPSSSSGSESDSDADILGSSDSSEEEDVAYEAAELDLDAFQPSQASLQSLMEEELSYGRGLGRARLRWLLRLDLLVFAVLFSLGILGFLIRWLRLRSGCPGGVELLELRCAPVFAEDGGMLAVAGPSWAWQLGADFEIIKTLYGLASLPFALLMIPLVRMVLLHSHDSGYNEHGQCVARQVHEDGEPVWKQRSRHSSSSAASMPATGPGSSTQNSPRKAGGSPPQTAAPVVVGGGGAFAEEAALSQAQQLADELKAELTAAENQGSVAENRSSRAGNSARHQDGLRQRRRQMDSVNLLD